MAAIPSRVSSVIVLVATVGLAFVAGRWMRPGAPPPAPAAPATIPAAPVRAAAPAPVAPAASPARDPLPLDLMRDELRAAIRDEVIALLDEREAAAAPEPPALPPEVIHARTVEARALLDGALAAARMDLAEHERFHALLTGLPRDAQEPLVSELHQAINAQALAIDL